MDGRWLRPELRSVRRISILEFVTSPQALPTEALRPDGSASNALGKELLVRMILEHVLLPRPVVLQPKQSPSTSPVDAWYMGPLRPLVLELLEGLPFAWDRGYVDDLLRPKLAEDLYRRRVSIDRYALRAIGLLTTYATFGAVTLDARSASQSVP